MSKRTIRFLSFLSIFAMIAVASMLAFSSVASAELGDVTDGPAPDESPAVSHRFIVRLSSPSLVERIDELPSARAANGRLDARSGAAQAYIQELQAEQAIFVADMQEALPNARVSSYINEYGVEIQETFQVVLNAVVVDAGFDAGAEELATLRALPGVKTVYRDYAYHAQTYTSTALINAPAVWAELGGQADAGRGIKVASVDGGLHKDAPMFSGENFDYPPTYPDGGKGLTANNNGKIIVSRAYFRSWDPPAPGDENPWPGVNGTSHGVHTGSTAAGNVVTDATYAGAELPTLSGVAPGAWVGSYRVFYASVRNDGSFYTAEGIAAIEDVVMDGMDVVNNSWGGGPGNIGGDGDALDTALVNAVRAGVFVSMSAGNAGPNLGTGDHPSPDYINVAASTSGGTYAAGRFNVTAPTPVPANLQDIPFATSSFGAQLPLGQSFSYTFKAAANVDPTNFEGCDPFPANTFDGVAAVISRGACEFGTKVLNAENAGAEFVVVHNHASGGEGLVSMAPGADGGQVTIPSIFVGNTAGLAIVQWDEDNGDNDEFTLDTTAYFLGNTPDEVASFSSRGPSTLSSLKPDIAAPGVNIMAQGYAPGATGEARHLGFGQVSGTSMAAPHVAGAAALLKGLYPDWTPAQIKSAMMVSSKYMDIYNQDGSPAQPTDMGAGRLDVAAAMDPGLIAIPPAADFGIVMTGTVDSGRAADDTVTRTIRVTNISDSAETYAVSTLYTGNGFTQTTALQGVAVSPTELTLEAGESADLTVTFDPANGMGLDINQGYIVMTGSAHEAHVPFFARVVAQPAAASVLLVDVDFSGLLGTDNYAAYYAATLDELGISYTYYNTAAFCCGLRTLPSFSTLYGYDYVVIFTGDAFQPDGTFTVPTPLTAQDQTLLNEYAQAGGKIIVMGQDAASLLDDSFFREGTLAVREPLQDSVSAFGDPTNPIVGYSTGPVAYQDVFLDLTGPRTAIGQASLLGANEVPPVDNAGMITGSALFNFSNFTNELSYSIEIEVSEPFSVTASHIHSGTVGNNGPVVFNIFPFTETQVVTDTLSWVGSVELTAEQNEQRLNGGFYVNVHTEQNPSGELRGQVPDTAVRGDGAGNQFYIDELQSRFDVPPQYVDEVGGQFLLRYAGPHNIQEGAVALMRRQQPTLENPTLSYLGSSIFAGFGLEGVNTLEEGTSRSELMQLFINTLADQPTASIGLVGEVETSVFSAFSATLSSNISGTVPVSYRWDWGDGSDYTSAFPIGVAMHSYDDCGTYTVRVEITDNYGNKAVGSDDVEITVCEPPTSATISGESGGSFTVDGTAIGLNFPPGAVQGSATVSVDADSDLDHAAPSNLRFAGISFSVEAVDGNGQPITSFAKPFTLSVGYSDSDWQNAGITSEELLNLYYFNEQTDAWVPILPCSGCSHDKMNNIITVQLDHLTEFALMGDKFRYQLPSIYGTE